MRIGIIGAGLAGLAAAAALAADGHSVEILERAGEPRPIGAGLLLQPPAIAFLHRIGALSAIAPGGARVTRLDARTRTGRRLIDLDYRQLSPDSHGLGVRRAELWAALLAACARAGVSLTPDQAVTSVIENDLHAVAQTADRSHRYDLIVVASGTNGGLARGRGVSRAYRWGCLWTSITLPPDWPTDVLTQRCDGARLMAGILPTGDRTAALYWSVRNDRAAAAMAAQAESWRDEIIHLWPQAGPAIAGLSPAQCVHATYRDAWFDPPYTGRVITIGDAAHGTSPQLGQGATQAFRDASALAACLGQEAPLAEQLAAYWAIRRARTGYYRTASRVLTPFFQSNSTVLGALRDIFAGPIAAYVPGFRRQALLTLAGAKTGYWGADEAALPGTEFPPQAATALASPEC